MKNVQRGEGTDLSVQLGFRPDIEGLRAVSILAVVLYHAQIPGFSGGFVGVDVFFVISGFLICRLLLSELATTRRLDLPRFWSRRARRLLPNAMLTLTAVLIVGYFTTPQFMRETLAREVASAALYVSNYWFAAKAVNYFQFDAPPSWVLHFWSLSVEEQFYIACPILLVGVGLAFRRNIVAAAFATLGAIGIASFAASFLLLREGQPLAFFHTEARAWQLATGGLLAVASRAGMTRIEPAARLPARAWTATGWLGLAAIAISVALFHDDLLYPGPWALLPTLGSAAVIAAGLGGSVSGGHGRLLESPALRWLGARSYSWYLWHWPILKFVQLAYPAGPQAALFSVPVSLVVASLVYSLLEDPVRSGRMWAAPPWRSLAAAAVAIALAVAASAIVVWLPDVHRAAPATLLESLKVAAGDHGRNYADGCHLGEEAVRQPDCAYGVPSAPRKVVLFGDSHAAQWFSALEIAASAEGWALHSWTKTSCPSVDVTIWHAPRRIRYEGCDQWRAGVIRELTGARRADVVFVSNLTDYSGWIQDRTTGAVLKGGEADKAWRDGMRRLLATLTGAGVAVVVVRDPPRAFSGFAECLAQGGGAACNRPRGQALAGPTPDIEVAREFGGKVTILDLSDQFCDAARCLTIRNGLIVYLDHHHVTATFAVSLSDEFRGILTTLRGNVRTPR